MTEIAGVAAGAVRVLGPQIPRAEEIETIPAAFEMDEILYELREHASGLNAGRWDYLFSVIKHFRDAGPDFVLPDRGSVRSGRPATGSTGPGSPIRTWSRPGGVGPVPGGSAEPAGPQAGLRHRHRLATARHRIRPRTTRNSIDVHVTVG